MDAKNKMGKTLSIIIVSYNTRELLINCIRSIYQNTKKLDFEIIVIDNHSNDGSQKAIRKYFENVILISNSKNRGFARANNQGIEISKGKYVLLLNSDTLVINNALKKLVNFLERNSDAGIVGPKVLNEDRSIQTSFGKFPTIKSEMARSLLLESRIQQKNFSSDKRLKEKIPFEVDWVSGCCLLIRRKVYDQIGGMDEKFFLFNEEVDWCLRASKQGWKTYYHPDAKIIHFGSRSVVKNYYAFIASRYESRLIFVQKHFNMQRQLLFRIVVIMALTIRIILTPVFKFSGKKEQKDRFRAYKNALLLHLGIIKFAVEHPDDKNYHQ
ncbi:MAG: glycosyltransferase family 2 protein [Promethearchaeota archaeon]